MTPYNYSNNIDYKYIVNETAYRILFGKDTNSSDTEYYVCTTGYDNLYYRYINWVVVAIPDKKDSGLPSYVIQVKSTVIDNSVLNANVPPNNYTVVLRQENRKVKLSDLLNIKNESVNKLMNPENYDLYAIILNTDGREGDYVFSVSSWHDFRNVIKLNDSDFQW